jgi:hypothetical protein
VTGRPESGIISFTMEITFHDPSDSPLPPDQVRIRALSAEPWPDGRRVAVEVQLTPFQQRPNLHLSILDAQGREVASVGAMQILQQQIGFTLHLRQPETRGHYTVTARLAYPDPELDLGVVDQAAAAFEIV